MEIGPKDMEKEQVVLAKRVRAEEDPRKEFVPEAEAIATIPERLDAFQAELLENATARREENSHRGVETIGELAEIMDNSGGYVYTGWSGDPLQSRSGSRKRRRPRCDVSRERNFDPQRSPRNVSGAKETLPWRSCGRERTDADQHHMAVTQPFPRIDGELWAGEHRVADLVAEFGSPLYVYDASVIEAAYRRIEAAFAGVDLLLAYSVKANSNLKILRRLMNLGAGADIVSRGELHRCLAAGFSPDDMVFAGVGKTEVEMEAALEAGILAFNVESAEELQVLSQVAERLGRSAPVALRGQSGHRRRYAPRVHAHRA